MDINRISNAKLAGEIEKMFGPAIFQEDFFASAKFVRQCVEDSRKELVEALKYVEETAKYHYNEEADEDDESPDDMTAHLNGLIVKKCQQALASVEGMEGRDD